MEVESQIQLMYKLTIDIRLGCTANFNATGPCAGTLGDRGISHTQSRYLISHHKCRARLISLQPTVPQYSTGLNAVLTHWFLTFMQYLLTFYLGPL